MTDTGRSLRTPGSQPSRRQAAWSASIGPLLIGPVLISSVLVAVVLWVVAVPLAGAELMVETGGSSTEVAPASVVLGSLVGGLGALAIGWAMRRWSSRPRRHFAIVTGLAAFLSLFGPTTAAESVSTGWWLCSMHVAVAVVAMSVVARALPTRVDAGGAQE